ncbi:MAG TPA: metalloregulator ArsR/SmtB family transcription factor [Ktedonobacteraceae bacterium]|jgi:ArsR family transcriptional regulator|nr:metalloregulator ArsR/SmtB family transcription factor [Ktedonobacteraceae bacterium]
MNDWRELKLMMKALSDIARLTIVYHLAREQEVTVTALTEILNLSQPLVSWHLRKLKRAGLVETHRVGRQVYCSLNRDLFHQGLARLQALADPATTLDQLPAGAVLMELDAALEE